ncbi:MAG: hypothetical protein WA705_26785 [Candidatus Ozemobacteraceae bacterium]
MIVFLPQFKNGTFIDATDKGSDPLHPMLWGLEGKEALILDEKNPTFVTIPAFQESEADLGIKRTIRVLEDGCSVIDDELSLGGAIGAVWRGLLLKYSSESRRLLLQRDLGLPEAEIIDINLRELEEPTKPLLIHFAYKLKRSFLLMNNRFSGFIRLGMDKLFLQTESSEKRQTPFQLHLPMRYQADITIFGPSGYLAMAPTEVLPELDQRFGVIKTATRVDGASLTISLDFRQKSGKFPAQDYSVYREGMIRLVTFLERHVEFSEKKNH